MMKPNMDRLAELFGSPAEVARAAGVTRSAVARWGRYEISPLYQDRLVRAAQKRGLDHLTVAAAAGVPRCPNCGTFHYNLGRAK
jgi:hypothetical protein